MIKKWLIRLFLGFAIIAGAVAAFFYFFDDLKIKEITSLHTHRNDWEVSPLSEFEQSKVDEILGQTFTFLGEGGQAFVFVSDDDHYVLKLFKFKRFRPTALVKMLPDLEVLSEYRNEHTTKRENKWLAAFTGHKIAYDLNRRDSGLVHIQLNQGNSKRVRLIDRWGFRRQIDLEKVPYVLQVKAQTLGHYLSHLLDKGKIDEVNEKINQLFHLYQTEYRKGIYDVDYGIMHNIGVVRGRLIHLDVGKMAYDERMKRKANSHYDLTKVATKVQSWVQKKYPKYAEPIKKHIEERLTALFGRKFVFPHPTDIQENKNFFSSEIYSHYAQHRKGFLHSHPLYENVKNSSERTIKALFDQIEMPLESPYEQRKNHEAIVQLLRKGVEEKFKPDARELYEDLIRWTYLQNDIQNDEKDFLFEFGGSTSNNLFRLVSETYQAVKEDPQFDSVKNITPYEDQLLEGNVPIKIGTVHHTDLIRMGQPLIVSRSFTRWFTSPTVTPEFLYFVQTQPSHLYVNLMRREGSEAQLTNTLEKLEKEVPSLYVVTLDKDSDFYWQDENVEFIEINQFVSGFYHHLLGSDYYWTGKMTSNEWQNDLKLILDSIQQKHFKYHLVLDLAERQDFIELSYLAILESLVQKLSPMSMNITCRQGIDRAPSLSALWLWQKKQLSFTNKEIAALLLAPPLIVHNRPSHSSRVTRFLSAASRIAD